MKINFLNYKPVCFGIKTSEFKIKSIDNIRCPVCDKITLTDAQIDEYANNVYNKKGIALAEALEKFGKESYWVGDSRFNDDTIYKEDKKDIVEILCKQAIEHPGMNLGELAYFEGKKLSQDVAKARVVVLNELEEYINRKSTGLKNASELTQNIRLCKKQILDKNNNSFNWKRFYFNFLSTASKVATPADCKKIGEILEKFPSVEDNKSKFFISKHYKAGCKNPKKTAFKLVRDSMPTVDHIIPASRQGSGAIKNYMVDCAYCNSKRGDLSFNEWQKTIPGFSQNLLEYTAAVQSAYNEGILGESYENYSRMFAETILKLTNGDINLKKEAEVADHLGKHLSCIV